MTKVTSTREVDISQGLPTKTPCLERVAKVFVTTTVEKEHGYNVLETLKGLTAHVYQVVDTESFIDALVSLHVNLTTISFTTHQEIQDFVEQSPEFLESEGSSYFLLHTGQAFYIVRVFRNTYGSNYTYMSLSSLGTMWQGSTLIVMTTTTLER